MNALKYDEVAAGPADALYLVMNTGLWWNARGHGYGSDPGAAEVWTRDKVLAQMRASPERHDMAVRAEPYLWTDARIADQAFRIWRGRGPLVHVLKTWPVPFSAVWSGAKRAEARRDDRGFEPGDILALREYTPPSPCLCSAHAPENIYPNRLSRLDPLDICRVHGGKYTGRKMDAIITHALRDSHYGIAAGYVMLSILPFPQEST